MTNEFISKLNDSSKSSYEAFQQLNAINVEAMQKFAALQFSLTSLNVESTVAQAKLLGSGTAPEELVAAETALVNGYSEKLKQLTSETAELMTNSRDQFVAFAEKTMTTAKNAAAAEAQAPKKPAAKKAAAKKPAAKNSAKKAA